MVTLSNAQKRNLLTKARSGDYYLWLTKWTPSSGQHILIWPTNKGLNKGITYFRNVYQVRSPKDKVTNADKKSGSAYRSGRFFTMDNSMSKILENKL